MTKPHGWPDPYNIVVSGVGGQGNVLASRLMGRSLIKEGYIVSIGETYGASQRGGAVMSHVRFSSKHTYGPLIPLGRAHTIIGLEPMETLRLLRDYGNDNVATIVNTRPIRPASVNIGDGRYPQLEELKEAIEQLSKSSWFVNATEMALEMGSAMVANLIMMGALLGTGLLPVSASTFEEVLRKDVPPRYLDLNLRAFRSGLQQVRDQRE